VIDAQLAPPLVHPQETAPVGRLRADGVEPLVVEYLDGRDVDVTETRRTRRACSTPAASRRASQPRRRFRSGKPEYDWSVKLLERERVLDDLTDLLDETRYGSGHLVLVAGEAGIGKTALLEAFCQERADGLPVLWGSCDPIVPARPFAPLVDIADKVTGEVREALDSGERDRVFEAFLALLRRSDSAPSVIVFDDLHWADDATLDLLRVVGRRLGSLPVLLAGTYRNDEVGGGHPLRVALGDVPAAAVTELALSPLSEAAVAALAVGSGLDAPSLHRATRGNPFFVTEVLAAGDDQLPVAVSDAVLARVARLSPSAREVLSAASVLGRRFEPALLRELTAADHAAVGECVERGMLEAEDDALRFRHELAQRAIREALPPARRVALHAGALETLRRLGTADPAELTRHAVEAGNAEAVLELAPAAAERAAGLGAHREAAAHYAAALGLRAALDERSRADLLEGHARECLALDHVDSALESQQEALESWRRLADPRREARCLRSLSMMLWFAGDGERAVAAAERAVELLERDSPPVPELAGAHATLAQRVLTHGGDDARALASAERALGLAEPLGDESAAVHALTTIGVAEIFLGSEGGWAKVEESLRRAKAAGLREDASRALINLVEAARDTRRYDVADRFRDEAISHIAEHDPDHALFRRRLLGVLAEIALERGRWEESAELAGGLLAERNSATVTRARALTVAGRLRVRRGDGDPWPLLDEALSLAGGWEDMCLLYAARAEAAWLEGDMVRARADAESGLSFGIDDPWWQGELGLWSWKAGGRALLPARSAEPYVLHASGRYRDAASAWQAIGCPYHQALALAEAEEEDDLRRALTILQSLGAEPMAAEVRRRLRAIGARNIPRGARSSTRRNAAGLTGRELEVLALIAEGMRNVDIAERLILSAKTVDHHVSAILRKLAVPTRAAAAKEAARLGLQDGELFSPS
jgi:DNA-binding CsgD family transcriptional regulator/tetratricopeptide (TPR) repeat protein